MTYRLVHLSRRKKAAMTVSERGLEEVRICSSEVTAEAAAYAAERLDELILPHHYGQFIEPLA